MSVYFHKSKSENGIFVTVGIKNPDIFIVATLTEEEFLDLVEQVRSEEPTYILPLECTED